MPMESSVKALPFGAITAAPAFTQRLASGISAVITMAEEFGALGDPVVGLVRSRRHGDALNQRILRHADEAVGDHEHRNLMAVGDAVDLVLDRAGVGIDINADRIGRSGHAAL